MEDQLSLTSQRCTATKLNPGQPIAGKLIANWSTWLLMLLCIMTVSPTAAADDSLEITRDAQLLNGLRERRLFNIADRYCTDLLTNTELMAKRRVVLTVQQLKNLTAQAVFATGEQRATVWSRIDLIANDFDQAFQGNRKLLVTAQQALAGVAEIRLLRQELDAELVGPEAQPNALERIRAVRRRLEILIRDIDQSMPLCPDEETETDLVVSQLLNLKANMSFQFAICNLERSRLYSAEDTANRADALAQATQQVQSVIRTVQPDDTLWWEAKLFTSQCLRFSGQAREAAELLARLPVKAMPENLQPIFQIEQIKTYQDNANASELAQRVRQLTEQSNQQPALDLALIEAAVWLGQHAPDQQQQWKAFATSLLNSIKAAHGSYWGRRAEIVLLGAIDQGVIDTVPNGQPARDADLTILQQVAKNAHNEKRFRDAVNSYREALRLAERSDNRAAVYQLNILISQCYEQLSEHGQAADALFAAAKDRRKDNSAAVHLRGCWNLSQAIGQGNPADSQLISRQFQEQLERHLRDWPQAATTNTARFWLAGQYRAWQQFQVAADRLLEVDPKSDRYRESIVVAAENLASLLTKMKTDGQAIDVMITRVRNRITNRIDGSEPVIALVKLLNADIGLRFGQEIPSPITMQILTTTDWTALADVNKITHMATAVQIVIDFNRSAEFNSRVAAIQNLAVLKKLDSYLRSLAESKDFPEAVAANLVVANRARQLANKDNSDTGTIAAWQIRAADLQLALGENETAIETLRNLVKQFPRKADLQIKLAIAVTQVFKQSQPETAINQWRRLASKLRPQTENWFLAKYNVALLLAECGKKEDAAKLLKFMQVTPPGWDRCQLKKDFDALLRRVDR